MNPSRKKGLVRKGAQQESWGSPVGYRNWGGCQGPARMQSVLVGPRRRSFQGFQGLLVGCQFLEGAWLHTGAHGGRLTWSLLSCLGGGGGEVLSLPSLPTHSPFASSKGF